MELLEINEVSLTYQTDKGATTALENITFNVKEGEFISIVGPSGCGKTTILSLIAGLIKQTHGTLLLGGKSVEKPSGNVGYMLQRDQLFEWRTIMQNVTLGLEVQKIMTPENINYASSLLDKYGLGEFKKSFPRQLSGGMRQRAALIRTLAYRPKILLLDEPFSALDFQTRMTVHDDISQIISCEGKTAILVTHDISEAIALSDRVIVLSKRPGTIKRIVDIDLCEKIPHKRRGYARFSELYELIWKEVTA